MQHYPPPLEYQSWLDDFMSTQEDNHALAGAFDHLSLRMRWQLVVAGHLHSQATGDFEPQINWASHALVCPPGIVGLKVGKIRYSTQQLGILTLATGGEFFDGDNILQACRELQDTQEVNLEIWRSPELLGLQVNAQGSSMFYLIDQSKSSGDAVRFISHDEFLTCYHHVLLHLYNGHPFGSAPEEVDPAGYEVINPFREHRDSVDTIAHGITLVSELLQTCPPHLLAALQNNPIKIRSKQNHQIVWTSLYIMQQP